MRTDLFGNELADERTTDDVFAGTAEEAIDWRRMGSPYSIDVPVSEAKQTFTLFDYNGKNGIFDHVGVEFVSKNNGKPSLIYNNTIYTLSKENNPWKFKSTMFLSLTSKMACPSFSLPAGTPGRGGSCMAADVAAYRKPGLKYTCDICYALKGNFFYPNVGTAQIARLMFVKKTLEKDPSGDTLADVFAMAITDFARGKVSIVSRDFGERLTSEIGFWSTERQRIMIAGRHGRQEEHYQTFSTLLPQKLVGVASSVEFFVKRKPKDGEVVGFFRIHDSGDFTIGSNDLSIAYLRAWEKTAQAFPNVIFWAPTKAWNFPFMARELRRIANSQKNFIVRPSAFNVGEPAPVVDGLVAGSAVARSIGKNVFERTSEFLCPVAKAEKKNCLLVGCRACWLATDLPVAYGEH